MDIETLQYPTGRFTYGKSYSQTELKEAIKRLKEFPRKLEGLVSSLNLSQLEMSYRPGGWNAIELVNHIGDVYINAYLRTKWLLTEDEPLIKPYDQDAFVKLGDGHWPDLGMSVSLTGSLITRWLYLLDSLAIGDFKKMTIHPENKHKFSLDELIVMYAWHGYHHLAHLKIIKDRSSGTIHGM